MRLSSQQIQTLIDYLKRWPKSPKCPICDHDDWAISDTVFQLTEHEGGHENAGFGSGPFGGASPGARSTQRVENRGLSYGSLNRLSYPLPQVFPVVPLTCKECGYVLLVSAIAAGVVPRTPA